jgi:16S rRNA (guanine527-N7)-methyltransferase
MGHVREALTTAAGTLDVLGRAPNQLVDVGAGAGLEALVLAIAWPQARVLAIEPRKLRAAFIAEAAEALGLTHVRVIAKTLHSADLGRHFELATARAVWPFPEWPEKARSILTPQGVVAIHAHGPAATLGERLVAPGWQVRSARDVPGDRPYAVAIVQAR